MELVSVGWVHGGVSLSFSNDIAGCIMCFGFGFRVAFVAKTQQKMNYHCTPKSRNLELHLTMSVFLLAASLNFKIYWRALLSFPVLANTGIYSGKLWLAQKLKVSTW